jgi:hypothetical protein
MAGVTETNGWGCSQQTIDFIHIQVVFVMGKYLMAQEKKRHETSWL